MNKERVLIIGGLGFIGSHIADKLCENRYDVSVVDKKSSIDCYANAGISYFRFDIANEKALKICFEVFHPDYVIHCAAEARIQPSFENPDLYFRSNVLGARNVLKLAKEFNVKRVVYSASSSAYDDNQSMPLREDMVLAPQALHPYGSTKRMGEMLMRDMGKATDGPETVCLRYFNVYGPRQTTLADGPYATVIGIFLDEWKNGWPLTIVPPGHQRRDFTHVDDVVEANILAMKSQKVGNAEIINIGSGKNYSIWEVAFFVLGFPSSEATLIESGKCVMLSKRKGEVFETLADISKAKKLLGWEPKISLEDGIKSLKSK